MASNYSVGKMVKPSCGRNCNDWLQKEIHKVTKIENELKFMLSELEFYCVVDKIKCRYSEIICKEKLQINYYFDSPEGYLRERGVTCRVRQVEGALLGDIKQHHMNKDFESSETKFAVETLPQSIQYDGQLLTYQGNLITRRHSFQVASSMKIECDINYYLGWHDFEVEIEYEAGLYEVAWQAARELGLIYPHSVSKSDRFFAVKKSSEKSSILLCFPSTDGSRF